MIGSAPRHVLQSPLYDRNCETSIHLSIFYTVYLVQGHGELDPLLANFDLKAQYILDWSPVIHSARSENLNQSHTFKQSLSGNWSQAAWMEVMRVNLYTVGDMNAETFCQENANNPTCMSKQIVDGLLNK